MGDQITPERSGIDRRLRRVWWLSAAGVAPYIAFVALLSLSPATLGLRPIPDTSISLAIWLALFLFAWPVVVAVIYIRGLKDEGR
jgi:uncharacterized membrane protein (DUF485 family)